MYKAFGKRILDLSMAITGLIFLSPLLIITAYLVHAKLGSPILFRQRRPGKDEKIFEILKFRTMTDQKDSRGNLLSDEQRLTRFGKWLRSSSIDELPELMNIVKGDMSLVGPRPLLVEYLSLYNEEQKKRHEVRPGLTGLAQINGRNAITWEEKFFYDMEYVNQMSLKNDILIMYHTIHKVWKKEGIHSEGCVAMKAFRGDRK